MSELILQLFAKRDSLVDIILQVELEEIVLPHEHIGCLINVRVQGHLSILSDIDTLLERVLRRMKVTSHHLE